MVSETGDQNGSRAATKPAKAGVSKPAKKWQGAKGAKSVGRWQGDKGAQQGAKFNKPKRKTQIVFSMKSRLDYLNGFSARKDERKKKGNLVNLKKERQAKREQQNMYRQHVQTEYSRAASAVAHNSKTPIVTEQSSRDSVATPSADESKYYPALDEFGNVCIQITSLESPQYSLEKVSATLPIPPPATDPKKSKEAASKSKAAVWKAKRSGGKKKDRRTSKKPEKNGGLKRVKGIVKPKSKKRRHIKRN